VPRKTRTRDWSGIVEAFFCKMTFASSKSIRREYILVVGTSVLAKSIIGRREYFLVSVAKF
jgi:hypothetical protein